MAKERRTESDSSNEKKDHGDLISGLPTAWDCFFRRPIYKYNGVWLHSNLIASVIHAKQQFVAQPEDIIVCSGLKTGTTWLKALVFATANRAQFDVESLTHPLVTNSPHDCAPVLETNLGKIHKSRSNLRAFSTHAPLGLLPDSVRSTTCKIIYIWRDPKDMFVSALYFLSGMNLGAELRTNALPTEEAFDQFCDGIFVYGPQCNHVADFLTVSKEQPDKFACFKYEDLSKDTAACVRRVAEFISQPFSQEEEERGVVSKIVKLCSFDNMRNVEATKKGEFRSEDGQLVVSNKFFYRRGEVEDWKNHLSDEMAARLDGIFRVKFAEAGLDYEA